MASIEEINTEAAKRIIELSNQGTPNWVEQSHAKDCEWEELPTIYRKKGRKGGWDDIKEAVDLSRQISTDRKHKILNCIANGDQIALELEVTGTLSMTVSDSLKEGDFVKSRIAMFLKFRDGKIIKQVDYILPPM